MRQVKGFVKLTLPPPEDVLVKQMRDEGSFGEVRMCVYAYVCMCACVYVCMCVYVYVCMCV